MLYQKTDFMLATANYQQLQQRLFELKLHTERDRTAQPNDYLDCLDILFTEEEIKQLKELKAIPNDYTAKYHSLV
jgi:hypothetical protein